jgi:acyl-CoA thioesterase FadM
MNLWFRLVRIVLSGLFAKRVGWLEATRVFFRVWPLDLDINLHMTNSRYLALMDLGRTNLIFQTGLAGPVWREKWSPVIAGSMVRFRRPLQLFQRLELVTQVLGYDEKWMFIEHRFLRGGDIVCQAVVKGCFLGRQGVVAPAIIARAIGQDGPPPALPDWIATWLAAEKAATAERKTT